MRYGAPLACVLILGLPVSAQAGDAILVQLIPKAQKGQGQPELVVQAQEPIAGLALDLKRGDGKPLKAKSGPLAPGKEQHFALSMSELGSAHFEGTLRVYFKSGAPAEMPISVDAELLAPLRITVEPPDVDLANHRVKIAANRSLARAELSLLGDTGAALGGDARNLADADGEGKYTLEWSETDGTILKISIQGWDQGGFFGGVDLFPWRVDIPHEELNFKSGKFDIDPSEVQKLDASFQLVQAAVQRYGKLATIKLFIAGHTDTVGDAASNRALSDNRARAIGRWFKKKGLRIPVAYAGFGEDLLLVETPDETDEPKNRRAEYIVAVEGPSIKGQVVRWRSLD